jgi:hypothetical protein
MTGTVLAFSQLALGNGNNGEWKSLGSNIDGETWTPVDGGTDPNHCLPSSGADPATVFPNGNNGIDNSFGHNLLPLILGIYPTLVSDTNNGLANGTFTAMLKMYCLPPTGDVTGMITKLFGGTQLGITADGGTAMTPKWDGTDRWPVDPALLTNPMDAESSSIVFPGSSVTGAMFDTGKNQTFVLTLPLNVNGQTSSLKLTLYAAEATATLSADRRSATGGVLGGVVDTEELVAELQKLGYQLNLCNQSFWPTFIAMIRQASDIMADGTQDPTKTCNGISVGLGFQLREVQLGPVGTSIPGGPSCASGAADAGPG